MGSYLFRLPLLLLVGCSVVTLLTGCSVVNDADDFRVGDAGPSDSQTDSEPPIDGQSPGCTMDEECDGFPRAAPFCDLETGECAVGACADDYDNCDGLVATGCETNLTTATDCGACANSCGAAEPLCQLGSCVSRCDAGLTECEGSCVDVDTSVLHCGSCGNACELPDGALMASCTSGSCGFECAAGFDDCDGEADNGCEAELATDPMHCGGCGVACGPGVSCVNATCDPYRKVSTQWDHVCALRESGAVDCWGNNESREANGGVGNVPLEAPSRLRWAPDGAEEDLRARDVSVGSAFTCFVSDHPGPSMGRLFCMGSNSSFRRGGATGSPDWPPQPVQGSQGDREFVRVELGAFFGCALDAEAGLWCFGENSKGQNGSTNSSERFARQVPFSDGVTDFALGHSAICAVLSTGIVECLGANESGQLGRGTTSGSADAFPVPEPVVGTDGSGTLMNIAKVVGTAIGFCAIDEAQTLYCWGRAGIDIENTPVEVATNVDEAMVFNFAACWTDVGTGEATCQGRAQEALFGDGMPVNDSRFVPSRAADLDGLTGLDGGYRGGCGFDAEQELRCWGYSVYGTALRDSLVEEAPALVVDEDGMPINGLTNLALATDGSCAVREGLAYCWGSGGRTDNGNGENLSYAYPLQIPGITGVTDVARSDFGGVCAIASGPDAGLYCWSTNSRGRLGAVGAAPRFATMVPDVPSPSAVDMAGAHTCAIVAGDQVMCWGANDAGQVGKAATPNTSELPDYVELDGERITASHITLGQDFACAILTGTEAGQVVCWGAGPQGQLGHGATPTTSTPVRATLANATEIEAGLRHVCAIGGTPRRVHCWGLGANGQRGDGTTTNTNVPTPVAGSAPEPVSVAAGYASSCAAYADDTVRCWGDNSYSQLGVAGPGALTPQLVPGVTAQTVAAGANLDFANCASADDGRTQCWGLNTYGKLSTSPVIHLTPQVVPR